MRTRLTPAMRDLLLDIHDQANRYPVNGNQRRTYKALERLGLIRNTSHDPHTERYEATDRGHRLAQRTRKDTTR